MSLPRSLRAINFTAWSLLALAVGLATGILGHASGDPIFADIARAVRPIGDLWMSALQMIVLPLIISNMLAAIVGTRDAESVGTLSGRAVMLFVVMLVAAALFTLAIAPPIISMFTVDASMIESLRATATIPDAAARAVTGPGTILEWLAALVPDNVFEAAVRGDLLPILLFTVIFGLAVTRLPEELRLPIARLAQGVAEAMLVFVRWVLLGTPVAVLILSYVFAAEAGGSAAELLAAFLILVCGLLLLFTALLYPASVLFGRMPLRTFARGLAPAQIVAVSTRSSIASLPALIDGARKHLRLPPSATSFVLPFSVSLFKVNRTISSPAKLLFLAHVYGVPLSVGAIATFTITTVLLSFTTVGLPQGATAFKTLPAYIAAGVPIEGVIILEAVETIPDIFKTLLNVTGYMSVATILSRASRAPQPLPRAMGEAAGARGAA